MLAAPAAQAQLLRAESVQSYGQDEAPVPADRVPADPVTADLVQVSVSRDIFRSGSRIGLSARTLKEGDGSIAVRQGLIGSWEISSGIEAGVGLFAIKGDNRKHNEFRRSWTAKDVTPRDANIAAVGMKLRF
jgi:hypothetical protein